jgi:hypothetical protein
MRDILKLTGVTFVPDFTPPTLIVSGKDLNEADEVYINECKSPSVVISNSQTLLAQVPGQEEGTPIRSIVVVSSRLRKIDRSKIMFRLGDNPKSVDGFERLIQTFLKIMLQSTNTDIFSPNLGGNLLSAVGKLIGNPSTQTLTTDFALSVTRARQQIMALQVGDPTLNLNERLAFARVLEVKFVPNELALLGKVYIGNQAGRQSAVGLGL